MKLKTSVCGSILVALVAVSPSMGDIIDFEDTAYTTPTPASIFDNEYVTRGVTNVNPDGAAGYILPFFGVDGFRFIAPHSGSRAVYVNTGVFPQPSFQRLVFAQPQLTVSFWIAVSAGDRVGVRVGDALGQETDLDQSVVVVPGQWTLVTIQSTSAIISTVQIQLSSQGSVVYAPWAFDDLSFVVPAPGPAAVFALALVAGAGRRRRERLPHGL